MTTSAGVPSASPSLALIFTPSARPPAASPASRPAALRATAPTSARSGLSAIAATSARPTQPVLPAKMMRVVMAKLPSLPTGEGRLGQRPSGVGSGSQSRTLPHPTSLCSATLPCGEGYPRHLSEKRLQPRLRPPQDQRVDVVRALVGVHGLEVLRDAHDVVFLLDAVAAVHVASLAGDVERLAAVVALDQRDRLRRELALVEEAPGAERGV